MEIGLFIGSIGSAGTVSGQVQQVLEAEQDGFHSFWAAHIMDADIMTIFSMAGKITDKIQMGTAVTPTFLRHPIAMAQQAITTSSATQGRFNLGMGVSHKSVVENRFGMKFHRPALHMKEYLEIVRTLAAKGSVSYEGKIFSATTTFTLSERHHLPVLIAALGPRMLQTAGQIADGTITWMAGPETVKTHIVPTIQKAAKEAGKDKPRIVVALPLAVSDDKPAAFNKASEHFERYGDLPSYRAMLHIEDVESPDEKAVIGDEAEVEEKLRGFAAAGATEIAAQIYPVGLDPVASVARSRALLKHLVGRI